MKKQIIEALEANGFKSCNNDTYWVKDHYKIKVTESDTMATMFAKMYNAGETLKIWEIKRVMQIV